MGIDKNEARNHTTKQPKGKSSGNPAKIPFGDMRFARIELTEQEKAEFRSLYDNGEFDPSFLSTLTDQGYTVKFGSDAKGSGKQCSVSFAVTGHPNSGWTLTGRASDDFKALAMVEFKHVYLCAGDPWQAIQDRRGGGYDDIG